MLPCSQNGRLGGRAATWEALGYNIKVVTAQAGPPRRLPAFYLGTVKTQFLPQVFLRSFLHNFFTAPSRQNSLSAHYT